MRNAVGAGVGVAHVACTAKYICERRQLLTKTLLLALMEQPVLPRHACCTIRTELGSLQALNANAPSFPVGVPYDAKSIERTVAPLGHARFIIVFCAAVPPITRLEMQSADKARLLAAPGHGSENDPGPASSVHVLLPTHADVAIDVLLGAWHAVSMV